MRERAQPACPPPPTSCPQILETPSLLASSSSTFGLKAKQPEAASSCCG